MCRRLPSTGRRGDVATPSVKASSVKGEGSFIAVEISSERHPGQGDVHIVDGIRYRAAGAEQGRVHLVAIDAAESRVARQETDRGRAGGEKLAHARVIVLRRAQSDQLALRPGAPAMHGRVDPAGEWILARKAEIRLVGGAVPVARRVERPDLDAGAIDRPSDPRRFDSRNRRAIGRTPDRSRAGEVERLPWS